MQADKKNEEIDFVSIKMRFDNMDNGYKAMMRRVKTPEDLRSTPAYYQLFPGERPHSGWLRVAYMLPWCNHDNSAKSFSEQLAAGKKNNKRSSISDMRIYQLARMQEPIDMEQLRRMAMQVKPVVNWKYFGPMVFYWGNKNKQRLIEDFFITKTNPSKSNSGEKK